VKYIFLTLLSLASISLFAGNEADSLRAEAAAWESPWRGFSNYFDYNPAASFSVPVTHYTEVGATYTASHADAGLHAVQDGNGSSIFQLHSESFQVDSKYRFFGKASYSNTTRTKVGWRDVEDYSLLNPYLVADSVGGDYKGESYFLSGGASVRFRHFEWGIRGAYEGGVSYRHVDPRPLNTVSVIRINPGATYQQGNWRFGWFGEYVRYRQNVEIQVEKDSKKIYFYLLQGFGTYNQQFSLFAENFNRNYKGNEFNTGIHLNYGDDRQSTGILGVLKTSYFQVDEDDRRTPYKIEHHEVTAQITHERELLGRSLFLKGLYTFHQIIGNETQYQPVVINTNFIVWNYATQSDRYQSRTHLAQVSALLADKKTSHFSVWEQLDGTFQDVKQYYYEPYYHQFVQDAIAAGTVGFYAPCKKISLEGSVKGGYKKNISSSLLQNDNNIVTTQLLLPDYAFLTSSYAFYQLNLKVHLPLAASLMANISADAGLQSAKNKQAFAAKVTAALNF